MVLLEGYILDRGQRVDLGLNTRKRQIQVTQQGNYVNVILKRGGIGKGRVGVAVHAEWVRKNKERRSPESS